MAAKVDIYTKFGCGYCFRAKSLLDDKGVVIIWTFVFFFDKQIFLYPYFWGTRALPVKI